MVDGWELIIDGWEDVMFELVSAGDVVFIFFDFWV